MNLQLLPDRLAVCRLAAGAESPDWVSGRFTSITHTARELSIVCDEHAVPADVRCERGWRALEVEGPLDFGLTGILSSLASPLAEADVSIFAISTFDTDYVLVRSENLPRAIGVLEMSGHSVVR